MCTEGLNAEEAFDGFWVVDIFELMNFVGDIFWLVFRTQIDTVLFDQGAIVVQLIHPVDTDTCLKCAAFF